MTVKQRLIEFIKFKKIGQKRFANIVGLSDGYVNAIRVSIQPDTLDRIAMCFPELNTGWLMTGNGEMLLDDEKNITESIKKEEQVIIPAEVFDKLSQLIDTVCAQQETIASQQRMIERLTPLEQPMSVREEDNAGCADAN